MQITIDTLFAGVVSVLPDGSRSGIYKRATHERRWLEETGVSDDAQADHDNHAGPERALHQYPAEHYDHWSQTLNDPQFVPGTFGENISTRGMTEADVYVGDIFTLGEAVIQLTQPRQPCWKPGTRTGHKTMAREIVSQGRAGWFFRVLQPGEIGAGDVLERTETADHGITLERFWELANCRTLSGEDRDAVVFLHDYAPLADEWRPRLKRRLDK